MKTNIKNLKLLVPLLGFSIFTTLLSGCEKNDAEHYVFPHPNLPASTILRASGDSLGIAPTVNLFKTVLGDQLNTTPNQVGGRREVNWDGVPPAFTNNSLFPLDFFNLTDSAAGPGRKRGLVYVNTGSPLRLDSSNFIELCPFHSDEFIPFTKKKMIVSTSSTVSEVVFKVPGTIQPASVKGFGIVFSDVDNASSTSVEFFNGNKSLGIYQPLPRTIDGGFSFIGVHFTQEKITRVKIISGNAVLTPGLKDVSDGGNYDLVVYDDFFYSEPVLL